MARKLPDRPKKPEAMYAEFDEEYSTWAVFGLNSGFCFAQPATKAEADRYAKEHNDRHGFKTDPSSKS